MAAAVPADVVFVGFDAVETAAAAANDELVAVVGAEQCFPAGEDSHWILLAPELPGQHLPAARLVLFHPAAGPWCVAARDAAGLWKHQPESATQPLRCEELTADCWDVPLLAESMMPGLDLMNVVQECGQLWARMP